MKPHIAWCRGGPYVVIGGYGWMDEAAMRWCLARTATA